jgi:hypothetical protein
LFVLRLGWAADPCRLSIVRLNACNTPIYPFAWKKVLVASRCSAKLLGQEVSDKYRKVGDIKKERHNMSDPFENKVIRVSRMGGIMNRA